MNKVDLQQFIRSDISQLEAYNPMLSVWDLSNKYQQSIKSLVKLDAGENPYGFSAKISEALSAADLFNYYPDPEYKKLRQVLADYAGVKIENIMVGAGSDELLDLVLRLILNDGDEVINCPPTFGMYSVLTTLNRGTIISVSRKADFSLDIPKILQKINQKTKAVFVCTPNNPTGNTASIDEILALLETGKLIIVDEAYFEFSGKSAVSLLTQYKNLIILRTFSKWAGMAGLRLGYVLMDSFFIKQLIKIKPLYNVNLAAEIAGIAALEDLSYSKKIIQKIIREREKMSVNLSNLPYLAVYPSEANLLYIKIKSDFSKLKKYLETKKIAVRFYQSNSRGNALRLTIGRPEQNDYVLKAFRGVLR